LDDVARIGADQRFDGQVHQLQRHLGLHAFPGIVGHLHVVAGALARLVRLVTVGGDGDRQLLLLGGDRQHHVSQLEGGHGVGLIGALGDDDRYVDVGRILGHDGQAQHLAVPLQR